MSRSINFFSVEGVSLLRKELLCVMLSNYNSAKGNIMQFWAFEFGVEAVRAVFAFADGDGGLGLVHRDRILMTGCAQPMY